MGQDSLSEPSLVSTGQGDQKSTHPRPQMHIPVIDTRGEGALRVDRGGDVRRGRQNKERLRLQN